MPENQRNGDGEKKPSSGGVKVFVFTSIAWLAIISSIGAFMFLDKHPNAAPGTILTQAQFLAKFESHQISRFVISYNPQNWPLTKISGRYLTPGSSAMGTDKPALVEIPFSCPAVMLTQKMQDELFASPLAETNVQNAMLWSIGYQLLFFIGLGGMFFIAVGGLVWFFVRHTKWQAGAA